MSITIQITPDDLREIRFAYNPLVELTTSYYVLTNTYRHGPYQRWLDETLRAIHGIDLPFMDALIVPGYMADFLTPTPKTVQLDIETEIELLLELPESVIHADVQQLIDWAGESEIRLYFLSHTREALHCLVEELRLYWRRALEPHWRRMTAILDGDLLYHGRRLAIEGPEAMLRDMHPRLKYENQTIHIIKPRNQQLQLQGQGLQLVPSMFTGKSVHWQVVPHWHPMLVYGARGAGLWQQEVPERNHSLELALGEGRARILQSLITPANTGEVARRLQITAGAASQHLSRLNEAGLVEPHRSGRRVYYSLTERGTQLLTLFR